MSIVDPLVLTLDVCGIHLYAPENAVVLSNDENVGIQTESRQHPTQPVHPGHRERREFEYVRHGAALLMAVMDVATVTASVTVTVTDMARNNSITLLSFLEEIDGRIDNNLAIHIVMDNGSSPSPRSPSPGWPITRAPVSTTPRSMPAGSIRSRSSFRSSPAICCDEEGPTHVTAKPFLGVYDTKLAACVTFPLPHVKSRASGDSFNELPRGTR